jgi:TolA-binding protein
LHSALAIPRSPGLARSVHVDAYYRRALASLGLGQTAEAKADLQKVIELQPEGEMATMAKKALGQLQ